MEADLKVKVPEQDGVLAGVRKMILEKWHHVLEKAKGNAEKLAEVPEKEKGKKVDWFNLNFK